MSDHPDAISPPLILASGSRYRQELLGRFRLPFQIDPPEIEETRLPNELARDYVQRLAIEKADVVALRHSSGIVIGSDQCAEVRERILGKPGHVSVAIEQLMALSGQRVRFHTGLCVMDIQRQEKMVSVELFEVQFRTLERTEVERYVVQEQPLDCAGSFKSEGLGISLFKQMYGSDPTCLMGLPLIRLREMLSRLGISVP